MVLLQKHRRDLDLIYLELRLRWMWVMYFDHTLISQRHQKHCSLFEKWNSLVTWFKLFDSFLALYHVIAAKLNQIQLVEIMCLHCLQRTPQIANCFPLDFEHCFLDELVLLWQHPLEELLDLTKMQRREIF